MDPTPLGFVTRQGSDLFYPDGKLLKFASMNVPDIFNVQDIPDRRGTRYLTDPYEVRDAVQSIWGLGGQVFRTYTFGFGPQYHETSPGVYSEEAFRVVDNVIAEAGRMDVKVIIPFINNGKDLNETWSYGTYAHFSQMRQKPAEAFFTDPQLIADFKGFISFVLNRRNTINGVIYKNDTAILGWQLGNELGGWKDPTPPANWTLDIARHIKTEDTNHLVIDGTLAGHDRSRWPVEALRSPYLDVFSNHYYWGIDDIKSGRIEKDADYVASFNKAFIITEFGLSSIDVYQKIFDLVARKKISGALLWSLRFHAEKGALFFSF